MKAKIFKHTLKTYFTVKIYRKVVKIAVVAKDSRKPLSPVVNIILPWCICQNKEAGITTLVLTEL